MDLIFLFLAGGIGAIGGYLVARISNSAQGQKNHALFLVEQEKVRTLNAHYQELKKETDAGRERIIELNNSLAATEADYRNLQEKLADQKNELQSLNEKFAHQFKNLANDIFEEKGKRFAFLFP